VFFDNFFVYELIWKNII